MAEARSCSPHHWPRLRDTNGASQEASRALRSMRVRESAGKHSNRVWRATHQSSKRVHDGDPRARSSHGSLSKQWAAMGSVKRPAGWQKFETCPDWGANSSGGISFREYLLQRPQRGGERLCRDYSQFLRQPGLVHGSNLIEQDQTPPATMNDADPKRCLATRRSHGCDKYCAQMIVHFGRGHYHTRARLPDFTPDSGLEIHEPNLSTRHQTNSESSALPNSPITSSSSPATAILLAASAQPVRAGLAGLRNTSAPSSIVISAPALRSRPSCASTGLGMTTPWELPICRMLTCTVRIVITMLFRRAWRVKQARHFRHFPFMPSAQK